jgi:hypothetical protein
MSWAAYAFIKEDQSDSGDSSGGEPVAWGGLVRQSLPLIVPDGDSPFAIASSVAEIEFCKVEDLEDEQSFPQGRIFGPLGELRWRPWCRGRHLVLLSDASADITSLHEIGFDNAMALDLVAEEPVPYLLWGELESDGKWRDGRIPRDLDYPVDQGGQGEMVWLRAKHYVDDAGVVQFTRYVDVITDRQKSS